MDDVVILSAVRTPIGAFQGALAGLPAHALGARALTAAYERAGVTPEQIQQVNLGCVLPAGQGQAPARQAALGSGCPPATGALTLNKVCGSGMRAVMIAANDLRCGDFQVVAAGGMESMSQAPYLAAGARDGLRLGHGKLIDSMIHDGLWDPYNDVHMGNCAELCAAEYKLSREEQDAFSLESYRRAREATETGLFAEEIVPVAMPQKSQKSQKNGELRVDRDEEPFKVDLDRMPTLRPAFQKDGTVTAANASKINDGAAALVLTTAGHAARIGARPLARIVAHTSFAQKPEWFTTAPVGAARAVLERAGLKASDIDLWEVNEAFAVVALAFQRELGLDAERMNVRGGAVALGHPIGCSGARILVTLLHALRQRGGRLGCAAICIGGGEATAMVIERVD
jgi:acetyl-CoA C-acetyltransferase